MRITNTILGVVLLLGTAGAARAAPEDTLLAGLASEFREPQLRCEWLARQFDDIAGKLSLHRAELANLVVSVDGAKYADSASGGVQRLSFESRLFGPPSVAAVLDLRKISSPERLKPGRRLEIAFANAAGVQYSLFCGHAVVVRFDSTLQRADVVALIPRKGAELQRSTTYSNMSDLEVLKNLAGNAGLALNVQDRYSRPAQSQIASVGEATWTFMRRLAERNLLELTLRTDGVLAAANSSFAAPQPKAPLVWTDMTWVDIAKRIAGNLGRITDARLTASYPRIRVQQNVADEDFLFALSSAQRVSAWFIPGKLMLVDDKAWMANAAARTVSDSMMTPLQLAARIAPDHGLAVQLPAHATQASMITQRNESDAEVLLRVLGASRLRLSSAAAGLALQPSQSPGDATDLLLQRITITGSTAGQRTFSRRFSRVHDLLLAPERLAVTEVVLDLGTAMPSVKPGAFALADGAAISGALDAAIARFAAQATGQTAERRFLQDLARIYRPTLIHLYRLQPDGLQRLSTISPVGS